MKPGDVVADRFEIERHAGAGGMSTVWRARDRRSGETVALKVLRADSEHAAERFVREAQVLAGLRHPGIVRYVAHGSTADGLRYLGMEWLEGENLADRLTRSGLTIEESAQLLLRLADALGFAHRSGIVHRDIKPGNLFLPGGAVDEVKILDFGIVALRDAAAQLTLTGATLGTPGYMAPEQARGELDVDARADVFSLGCVFFKCLTGRSAFAGNDVLAVLLKIVLEEAPRVSEFRPEVPPALDDLVAQMLAKSPEDRPADAGVVAERVRALGDLSTFGGAPRSVTTAALGTSEQRVLAVVLVRPPKNLGDDAPTLLYANVRDREAALRRVVERHGGRLDFLADGSLVVTFVDAETAIDQAARAGRCALEVRPIVGEVPMALVAGRGVVAQRNPLGDVIDRGVDLLARAAPGVIRVDDVSADLVDARFHLGRDEEGRYLQGEREMGAVRRTLLGKPTPCVGREPELSALKAFFEACAAEHVGHAILVTGTAGVGKSRLRYEFLRRIRQVRPLEVILARGDAMSGGAPFAMLAPAIRWAAGVFEGEPMALRRQKLRTRIARHVPPAELTRVTEFIGELVGIPFGDDRRAGAAGDGPPPSEPEPSEELRAARRDAMLMGDQMRRAFADWMAAECEHHPVVIVLEDLHWGDLATVQFVDAVLRTLQDKPILVLALGRPEVTTLFPNLWADRNVQEIRLRPLTRKGAEGLVRRVLGEQAPAETVDRVVDRAGGNPFYLEELIRAVALGRGERLPDTVLGTVQSRLAALEVESRRVLRAASVFGQVFWKGGVEALLGGAERTSRLDEWLDGLVRGEVIALRTASKFPTEKEYVFGHALMREAAYAMLTEADRRLGHALAATWLEAAGESEAGVLAEHFERGDEPARAIGWYRRAAEQALEGNDLDAALRRAERAVECGAGSDVLGAVRLLQAEAYQWRGAHVDVDRCAHEAMAWLPRGSAAWFSAAGEAALAAGRLGKLADLATLAVDLCETEPAAGARPAQTIALARTAMRLFVTGLVDLGGTVIEHLDAPYAPFTEERPEPLVEAWIHRARASRALVLGDLGVYLGEVEASRACFVRAGDLRMACAMRGTTGFAWMELGQHGEAEAALTETVATASRMGLDAVTALARQNLGVVLARTGRFDAARAAELDALRAFVAQGDKLMECAARYYLATILLHAGQLEEAEREAREALVASANIPPNRVNSLATLARILVARGRPEEARDAALEAARLFASLGAIDEGETLVHLVQVESLEATGDHDGARAALLAGKRRLLERASRISDERHRESFLAHVPDNARLLELSRRA